MTLSGVPVGSFALLLLVLLVEGEHAPRSTAGLTRSIGGLNAVALPGKRPLCAAPYLAGDYPAPFVASDYPAQFDQAGANSAIAMEFIRGLVAALQNPAVAASLAASNIATQVPAPIAASDAVQMPPRGVAVSATESKLLGPEVFADVPDIDEIVIGASNARRELPTKEDEAGKSLVDRRNAAPTFLNVKLPSGRKFILSGV